MGREERIGGSGGTAAHELRDLLERIIADESCRDRTLPPDEHLGSLAAAIEAFPGYAVARAKYGSSTSISAGAEDHLFYFNTATGSLGFSADILALGVLRRAQDKGVAETLHHLHAFFSQEVRSGRLVMLISSAFVLTPIRVAEGISLVPLEELKNSTLSSYEGIKPLVGGHMMAATAALVTPHAVRPAFGTPTPQVTDASFAQALIRLEDARRCLCFFGPSTPVHLTHIWEPDEDTFGLEGSSWSSPLVELIGHEKSHALSGPELHEYSRLLERFSALPEHNKRVLRVAIDRVNRALRRHWSVDAAIELGIALEAFFLSDDEQSELTYRLALRCAWWLGETPEERKQLMKWARVVYQCRSDAVHRGYLAEKLTEKWAKSFRGRDTREFIHEACARVLRAIELALVRGMPDWAALVTGEPIPREPSDSS